MRAEYCEGALRAGASYCLIRVMGSDKVAVGALLDHQDVLLLRNTPGPGSRAGSGVACIGTGVVGYSQDVCIWVCEWEGRRRLVPACVCAAERLLSRPKTST